MKYCLIAAVICLVITPYALAQTSPEDRILEQLWPEGEKRIYRFVIDDREIGRLETVMNDISKEDGSLICEIEENLKLDFTENGEGLVFDVEGRLIVSGSGHMKSSDVKVRAAGREERIRATFDTDGVNVVIEREGGEPGSRRIPTATRVFAIDNYMLHQFELALMNETFLVGKPIVISGFSVQGMYAAQYEFIGVGKVQVQYGAFTDSVWQVDLVRPAKATFYIDRRHKIVKWINLDQDLMAEIVIDPYAKRRAPQKSLLEIINDQMVRLPIYGLYLLIAFIWLLFLGRDSHNIRWSYLLFVMGGLAYPIIYITQAPLQKYYAIQVLAPTLGAGDPIFIQAMIPALLTGLIQESLKLIPLLVVVRIVKPKPISIISMGAFVGAGFGFVEACQIVAPLFQERLLTGYTLIERVFTILSHATLGAALGYGIARNKIWQLWLIAAGLHSFGNYLIIFVQLKMLTIKGLNIILGLYDIALLVGMVSLQRMFKSSQLLTKKARR